MWPFSDSPTVPALRFIVHLSIVRMNTARIDIRTEDHKCFRRITLYEVHVYGSFT